MDVVMTHPLTDEEEDYREYHRLRLAAEEQKKRRKAQKLREQRRAQAERHESVTHHQPFLRDVKSAPTFDTLKTAKPKRRMGLIRSRFSGEVPTMKHKSVVAAHLQDRAHPTSTFRIADFDKIANANASGSDGNREAGKRESVSRHREHNKLQKAEHAVFGACFRPT